MTQALGENAAASARVVRIADVVLIGLGSICSLFLLYAIVMHHAYFVGGGRIGFYYVAPALLATGLFLSLRLRPERRAQLALLGITSLSGLALLELTAAWNQSQLVRRAARRFGFEFDPRSMLEVVRDLNAQGRPAVASIFPADVIRRDLANTGVEAANRRLLPLGGLALRPTVLCNELGPYVIYDSDEHGFNNLRGAWNEPVEVLLLGDSFVHGRCVAPDKNLGSLIRARYPHTLNLGMSGSGPLLELAMLRELAPALRPSIVLWFYYEGNDLTMDLYPEKRHPMLLRYLEDPAFRQDLLSRQAESDAELLRILASAQAQATLDGQRGLWGELISFVRLERLRATLGLSFGRGDPDLGLFARVLSEAQRTVKSWDGALVLVYLPGGASYGGFGLAGRDTTRAEVLALPGRLGIPVVDMEPLFSADANSIDRYSAGTGHYTEEGYRAVADAVVEAIERLPN